MKKLITILIVLFTLLSCSEDEILDEKEVFYTTYINLNIDLGNSLVEKYDVYFFNESDTFKFSRFNNIKLEKDGTYKVFVKSIPEKMTWENRKDCVYNVVKSTWNTDTLSFDYVAKTTNYINSKINYDININKTSIQFNITEKYDGKKSISSCIMNVLHSDCSGNTFLLNYDAVGIDVTTYNTRRGQPVTPYTITTVYFRTYIPICE